MQENRLSLNFKAKISLKYNLHLWHLFYVLNGVTVKKELATSIDYSPVEQLKSECCRDKCAKLCFPTVWSIVWLRLRALALPRSCVRYLNTILKRLVTCTHNWSVIGVLKTCNQLRLLSRQLAKTIWVTGITVFNYLSDKNLQISLLNQLYRKLFVLM